MKANKRLSSLSAQIIIFLFSALILSQVSCSKKEDDDSSSTPERKPVITLAFPDTNFIEAFPSQVILINLVAESNQISGKELSSFSVTSRFEDNSFVSVFDTVIHGNEFMLIDFPIQANPENGTEIWLFKITDVDGQKSEISITLNITGHPPSIALLGGTYEPLNLERIDGDVTKTVGEQIVFGIVANSQSSAELRRIFIQRVYENVATLTLLDSSFSQMSFELDVVTWAYPAVGQEVFTCTVWDKNDFSASVEFTVTTVASDPEMSTFTNIVLGSYDPAAPNSSFASVTGETFSIIDAAANSDKIDWIYFDGATYGNTIMAPSDDFILQVFASVENWTTRNATKFVRTNITASVFDAISEKNALIASISPYLTNLNESFISELMPSPGQGFSVGDVYGFRTAGTEHLGLIKITEVNEGATNGLSTIKYDVKVQE
jgi:hypothetical protein